MDYQRFDPTDCGFPKPRVPLLPALSRQSLGGPQGGQFRPLGCAASSRFFSRGRYALAAAYRLAGVGVHGALLAPAYHCRTMLDPAIGLGAEIGLYALRPDLAPDLDALAASLAACPRPVKALLVAHYFGFPQPLAPLAAWCAEHGVTLIEDCSHALFVPSARPGTAIGGAMGATGRFGVASPGKFFPCEDGGLLWARGGDLPAALPVARTVAQELRGLVHAAQRALGQARSPDVAALDHEIDALAPARARHGRDAREHSSDTSDDYLATDEQRAGLAGSRWVMRHTNVVRLAGRRRQNYQRWADAVSTLPHCRALYPRLPLDCVPYMFPLQVDRPDISFFALKRLGVPVWRWDDMAISACPVAANYRLTLLHLPCHQELSAQQMLWMTTAVSKLMSQLPKEDK